MTRYKRHLIEFIKSLPHGARVLDVGCGTGKTIEIMQALRPDLQLEGVDFVNRLGALPGVTFTLGSAEELPALYPENTFDAVICQHLIEHLQSPEPLVRGIRHALKPGGRVFIETPNWVRLYTPFAHFYFWNDYTHVRVLTPFALRKLFLEQGFSVERIATLPTSQWFIDRPAVSVAPVAHQGPPRANDAAYRHTGLITRIFARLVNPLLNDLLIGIASKGS